MKKYLLLNTEQEERSATSFHQIRQLFLDAVVDVVITAVYIYHIFVVNQGFHHKGGEVEACDVGVGYQGSEGGNRIVNIKILCPAQGIQAAYNLVFNTRFAYGLNEPGFNEFHGDCIAE